jgi:hypothetical protein
MSSFVNYTIYHITYNIMTIIVLLALLYPNIKLFSNYIFHIAPLRNG